jgi:hypothetical protein
MSTGVEYALEMLGSSSSFPQSTSWSSFMLMVLGGAEN